MVDIRGDFKPRVLPGVAALGSDLILVIGGDHMIKFGSYSREDRIKDFCVIDMKRRSIV